MDLNIKGNIALVTGASRGIGRGVCLSLAKEGVKIIAISKGESDLKSLIKELNAFSSGHKFLKLDLSKKKSINSVINFTKKNKIKVDILVNNVGGNLDYSNPLGPIKEWQEVMYLNVEIAIQLNKYFIPIMQKRKWGRVCHISSVGALENQGPPAYSAAKAALNVYVRGVGRYVSADNVILTSVMSGPIYTKKGYWDKRTKSEPKRIKQFIKERVAINRFGKIKEVSEVVSFLCSTHASFCVGSCFLVDGGQGRVFYPNDFK